MILDTSVAVDHLRGHRPATELIHGLLVGGERVVASELVRFELVAGVRQREIVALGDFLSALSWVAVTSEVARAAGLLARRYRRSHSGIDTADYLIAATALFLEAELLTTNVRHFPMLPGLRAPY